jgi:hypothetical protein
MHRGRVVAELAGDEIAEETVLAHFFDADDRSRAQAAGRRAGRG